MTWHTSSSANHIDFNLYSSYRVIQYVRTEAVHSQWRTFFGSSVEKTKTKRKKKKPLKIKKAYRESEPWRRCRRRYTPGCNSVQCSFHWTTQNLYWIMNCNAIAARRTFTPFAYTYMPMDYNFTISFIGRSVHTAQCRRLMRNLLNGTIKKKAKWEQRKKDCMRIEWMRSHSISNAHKKETLFYGCLTQFMRTFICHVRSLELLLCAGMRTVNSLCGNHIGNDLITFSADLPPTKRAQQKQRSLWIVRGLGFSGYGKLPPPHYSFVTVIGIDAPRHTSILCYFRFGGI